jgi:hypothetical protein
MQMTEPISHQFRDQMNAIAQVLDEAFNGTERPKKNAFVLLLAPFDGPEGARTNYISNGRREDILVMMKEVIARFEGQPEQKGTA